MVKIAGAWFDEIIQYGENTEHRRTKHLDILESTERKFIDNSNLDLFLKDDFKIFLTTLLRSYVKMTISKELHGHSF